jgi:hypothetical protein
MGVEEIQMVIRGSQDHHAAQHVKASPMVGTVTLIGESAEKGTRMKGAILAHRGERMISK